MAKRQGLVAFVGVFALVCISVLYLYTTSENRDSDLQSAADPKPLLTVPETTIEQQDSKAIMSAMGNQTERAELGRATWKFLHTMMARYPEQPTPEEKKSLKDFMLLFSTLYPCGECATHFSKLITTYPPQTSSRSSASQWLCAMHNKVNERLKKPIFDCSNIESKYPCGCAEEKGEKY